MRHTSNKFLKEMVQEVLLEQGTNSYNWENSAPGEAEATEPEPESGESETEPAEKPAADVEPDDEIRNLYDFMNSNPEINIESVQRLRPQPALSGILINSKFVFYPDVNNIELINKVNAISLDADGVKTITDAEAKTMEMKNDK